MAISLGGYDLLVPTPELSAWLDRYLPTANLEIFTKPVAIGPRADSISSTPARINLGLPNYTAPSPQVCVNRLYWPTGASRWSHFFGLCDKATLASLLGTSGTYTLKLTDESRSSPVTIETAMYLLPPRMIPATMEPAAADELWLLPLVDVRYWWQFANSGNVTVTAGSTTWSTAMQAMATALGVTLTIDTVDSAYLKPDPVECARDYENPAVLLDAMAHSVGQRVLRELDGTLASKDFASRPGPGDTNLATSGVTYEIVAGGDFSDKAPWLATPVTVRVVFPEYINNRANCGPTYYIVDKSTDVARANSVFTKTVRSTAAAHVTATGGTPTNSTELSTLAGAIKDAVVDSLKFYDYTFAGLKSWQMTAHDDAVEWHMASLGDGGYRACTRVRSMPYNFGVEEMLHQGSSDVIITEDILIVTLDDDLVAGGSVDATTPDGDTITVHDWAQWPIASGKQVKVHYDCEDGRWHPLAAERTNVDVVNSVCCVSSDIEGNKISLPLDAKIDLGTDPCGGETGEAGPAEQVAANAAAQPDGVQVAATEGTAETFEFGPSAGGDILG